MDELELEKLLDAYSFNGVIESFDGKQATVALNDGQKIIWPVSDLPDDCRAGTPVKLKISSEKSDQVEREKLAKNILNEILKENS